jgi:excisionase family DNA binding protein
MQEEFMSIDEFAKLLKVHPNTIRNGIKTGRINAFKVGSTGKSAYRLPRSQIHRLADEERRKIEQKYGLTSQIVTS